jgi:hypothetical protein
MFLVQYVVLKVTLSRWWDANSEGMKYWSQCRRIMQARFDTKIENIMMKYTGDIDP